MTQQFYNERRAKIVRRWAAIRSSLAQRGVPKKRRGRAGRTNREAADSDEESENVPMDLNALEDLPDSLLG